VERVASATATAQHNLVKPAGEALQVRFVPLPGREGTRAGARAAQRGGRRARGRIGLITTDIDKVTRLDVIHAP
jgi:hypothetical protein